MIKNDDDLCLPRALIVGETYLACRNDVTAEAKKKWERARDGRYRHQRELALQLMRDAGVTIDGRGAGYEEIVKFQAHYDLKNISIVAFDKITYGQGSNPFFDDSSRRRVQKARLDDRAYSYAVYSASSLHRLHTRRRYEKHVRYLWYSRIRISNRPRWTAIGYRYTFPSAASPAASFARRESGREFRPPRREGESRSTRVRSASRETIRRYLRFGPELTFTARAYIRMRTSAIALRSCFSYIRARDDAARTSVYVLRMWTVGLWEIDIC
ncbi:unnamed protein product [Trichogramma brassicae]|uniref:Uncharacterized protein n=1 Tax=Trichogramma brassicae TaxID=86971 RepID=A0A6H5ID71_9HYME|nr:unnamed protein product [Trichogramma brassicae]